MFKARPVRRTKLYFPWTLIIVSRKIFVFEELPKQKKKTLSTTLSGKNGSDFLITQAIFKQIPKV